MAIGSRQLGDALISEGRREFEVYDLTISRVPTIVLDTDVIIDSVQLRSSANTAGFTEVFAVVTSARINHIPYTFGPGVIAFLRIGAYRTATLGPKWNRSLNKADARLQTCAQNGGIGIRLWPVAVPLEPETGGSRYGIKLYSANWNVFQAVESMLGTNRERQDDTARTLGSPNGPNFEFELS